MYFSDLMRIDPIEEMNRIKRDMNLLFNGLDTRRNVAYPALNVWGNDDGAYVTAELPGYDSKDYSASVVGDKLILSGERKAPKLDKNDVLQRQERVAGKFERSIRLPFPVENDKIKAEYRNGVLSITLPRSEDDKPKIIEIQSK